MRRLSCGARAERACPLSTAPPPRLRPPVGGHDLFTYSATRGGLLSLTLASSHAPACLRLCPRTRLRGVDSLFGAHTRDTQSWGGVQLQLPYSYRPCRTGRVQLRTQVVPVCTRVRHGLYCTLTVFECDEPMSICLCILKGHSEDAVSLWTPCVGGLSAGEVARTALRSRARPLVWEQSRK